LQNAKKNLLKVAPAREWNKRLGHLQMKKGKKFTVTPTQPLS
jgi:hypothetical protein